MVTKRKCSFCGRDIEPGTGKMVVAASGSVSFYCSSKCEKNHLKLKRSPRRVRWTRIYQEEKSIRVKGLKEKKPKIEEKKETPAKEKPTPAEKKPADVKKKEEPKKKEEKKQVKKKEKSKKKEGKK